MLIGKYHISKSRPGQGPLPTPMARRGTETVSLLFSRFRSFKFVWIARQCDYKDRTWQKNVFHTVVSQGFSCWKGQTLREGNAIKIVVVTQNKTAGETRRGKKIFLSISSSI